MKVQLGMKNNKVTALIMTVCLAGTVCGCAFGNNAADEGSKTVSSVTEDSSVVTADTEKTADAEKMADIGNTADSIDTADTADTAATGKTADTASGKEIIYDRQYLKENNGAYTYQKPAADVIKKYDGLYKDVFRDLIASNNSATGQTSLQEQRMDPDTIASVNNLVMQDDSDNNVINTGSYYEMDYNFDLHNVGYTYIDLNSDGIYELIFGVLKDADVDWSPYPCFERAYALVDGKAVKFFEGGSRDLCWLGSDGYIYEDGSGGADCFGIAKQHFDIAGLKKDIDWGGENMVLDEYIGCSPEGTKSIWFHLYAPITDLDEITLKPEDRITEKKYNKLEKEWYSRQTGIEWLKISE